MLVLMIIVVLVVLFLAGMWSIFGPMLTAAKSVKKLEDGLYRMDYNGDYGFDEYLARGGASSDAKMAEYIAVFLSHGFIKPAPSEIKSDCGCSTMAVGSSSGGQLLGRNFDWWGKRSDAMIVHTKPKQGYESYSTCCLNFLGFGDNWKPEGLQNQYMALAAIYVPLDGINEKGLCVADLICGDAEETHQTEEKPDLTTTSAIRLLLDKAATVDEAVSMLAQYNMHSSIGNSHHLAIADASGKSVVVEYVNNERVVTETETVTNHYLSAGERYGVGNEESHVRFGKLAAMREQAAGVMNAEKVRECMESVSYPEITQWSIVFDLKNLEMNFYWQRQYERSYRFAVGEMKN